MPPVPIISQDGAAIRARRIRKGWTLDDLALRIGRHPKALGHLERETRTASAVMLNQIANALGVEPEDITKEDVTEPRSRERLGSVTTRGTAA